MGGGGEGQGSVEGRGREYGGGGGKGLSFLRSGSAPLTLAGLPDTPWLLQCL